MRIIVEFEREIHVKKEGTNENDINFHVFSPPSFRLPIFLNAGKNIRKQVIISVVTFLFY